MRIPNSKGFTLIELIIVAGLTIFMTMNLLTNFLKSQVSLDETARILISDIRAAQANALSSKKHVDSAGVATNRCGYGIHQVDASSYYIYIGRVPNSGNCPNDYKFGTAQDTPILKTGVLDARLEFYDSSSAPPNFYDVLFEPPDGKIWIDNLHVLSGGNPRSKSRILIKKIGATCPSSNCLYICVYASGRIESRATDCP